MTTNILSKYSQSPYTLIGLELTDQPVLILSNNGNFNQIKQIFNNVNDCENFIVNQNNDEKIVLIVAGHLLTDELTKFQNYSQIDSIYLYPKSGNPNEEFECVYKKVQENKYLKIFIVLCDKFWFLLGLAIVVILAYLFPHVGASNGPLYAKYTVKWGCVIIILLFSSLSLTARNLYDELHNIRLLLCIQIFSLVLVPFSIFGVVLLLANSSINNILLQGLILMACIPTGITINIIVTKDAQGNESGTLLNGLLGSFTGVFVSPALITFFMKIFDSTAIKQTVDIQPYFGVLGHLSLTALLPLVVGQIINFIWTEKIMWAKIKFHFSKIISVALLILVWTVVSDLFESNILQTVKKTDFIIIVILNAAFFLVFTLLALFIARLPNVCFCRKQETNHDYQPLLKEHQSKSPSLIERWRFSRENTITFMFCGVTKTLSLGLPLITAIYADHHHGYVGLLSLPLILFHIELLILCSIEVLVLQQWYPPKNEINV